MTVKSTWHEIQTTVSDADRVLSADGISRLLEVRDIFWGKGQRRKEIESRIDGDFEGFEDEALFRLQNGEIWQQVGSLSHYHKARAPKIRIATKNGAFLMKLEGLEPEVPVLPVTVLVRGRITSDFRGFKQDARFQFDNGEIWKQLDGTYYFHEAHHPEASVVQAIGGATLLVRGLNEMVPVKRIR